MTKIQVLAAGLTVGLLLTLSAVCRSAEGPPAAEQKRTTPLGPGDPVTVQVLGQPEATNVFVADDGTINVPLVGNVQVSGMLPVDAAKQVAKALKDGGYFVDPHVTIVTQPRSQVVTVLGAVHTTGRFAITPGTTILDLLAQAGGVTDTAADFGYILRKDDSGHINRYPIKLNGLTDIKDSLPTSTLLAGDSLVVPLAENIYVNGEVTSPGKFPIEPGMTVMQAILHAGGINERGSEHRIELKRLGKGGKYETLHPKQTDPVQGGDIIRVKESIF